MTEFTDEEKQWILRKIEDAFFIEKEGCEVDMKQSDVKKYAKIRLELISSATNKIRELLK